MCDVNNKPSLLCGVIKPKVSQNLILSQVITVSTNENTENSHILWDVTRFAKEIHLKNSTIYNSSVKKQWWIFFNVHQVIPIIIVDNLNYNFIRSCVYDNLNQLSGHAPEWAKWKYDKMLIQILVKDGRMNWEKFHLLFTYKCQHVVFNKYMDLFNISFDKYWGLFTHKCCENPHEKPFHLPPEYLFLLHSSKEKCRLQKYRPNLL